jgi:hypothetical protein
LENLAPGNTNNYSGNIDGGNIDGGNIDGGNIDLPRKRAPTPMLSSPANLRRSII